MYHAYFIPSSYKDMENVCVYCHYLFYKNGITHTFFWILLLTLLVINDFCKNPSRSINIILTHSSLSFNFFMLMEFQTHRNTARVGQRFLIYPSLDSPDVNPLWYLLHAWGCFQSSSGDFHVRPDCYGEAPQGCYETSGAVCDTRVPSEGFCIGGSCARWVGG